MRGGLTKISGLSLTEVMIAMVVIALAVLSMLSSQAFGFRALAVDPVRQKASEVTNRALTRAELALRDDFSQSVIRSPEPDSIYPDYTVGVTEVVEDPPQNLLKRVTVTTTWQGKKGEEKFELWTVFVDETAIAP